MGICHLPARNCSTTGKPYCSDRGSTPTADETEKRPPTQSQKPNTFSAEMPNAVALGMVLYVTFYMLYVICYMLFVICCMLYVICYMLYVICYMLFVICCMLYVVCYLLYVICYLLYVICYMLYLGDGGGDCDHVLSDGHLGGAYTT
jgi:hypothetical protein